MKDTFFSSNLKFKCQGILHEFDKPIVMGIINATPDSFYAKSRLLENKGLEQAEKMIEEGAKILDIGGYSSRPGAADISVNEEILRVVPLIRKIRDQYPSILISIDTFRSEVAAAAIDAGANIVNDISGGQLDTRLFEVAGKNQCPYILMHMRGTPQSMMNNTNYINLIEELNHFFKNQIDKAQHAGVSDFIIDPGFGFSKTTESNYELMAKLEAFQELNLPILVGVSRKSMIRKKLNVSTEEALNGTSILNTIALMKGAHILRVHDVKPAFEAVELVSAIR
ncbi:dihydropteroate synthase [Crocinitomix algicola]|uniref:dihydropteroate synthase n=1 Tax=Crocinitomix algicola TaxID=1740263 RepID=UPI000833AA89|nr:dihydropteroate synthase [Crocinitomix algicola]